MSNKLLSLTASLTALATRSFAVSLGDVSLGDVSSNKNLRLLSGMTAAELEALKPHHSSDELEPETPHDSSDGDTSMEETETETPPSAGNDNFDDANEVFTKAVEAIGGAAALMGLGNLDLSTTGAAYGAFEAPTPDDISGAGTFTRSIQVQGSVEKMRIEDTMAPQFEVFPYIPFVFPPSSYNITIDGYDGHMDGRYVFIGNGTMPIAAVMAFKRQQYLFNPHYILQKVLQAREDDGPSLVSPHPSLSWFYVRDDVFPAMAVSVDPDTGFIETLTTMESSALVRDVQVSVHYANWTLVAEESGLVFPASVKMTIRSEDPLLLWEEVRHSVATPVEVDDEGMFNVPTFTEEDDIDQVGYDFGLQSQHLQNQWFASGFGEYPNNPSSLEPVEVVENVLYFLPSFETANSAVLSFGDNQAVLIETPAGTIHGANLVNTVQQLLPGSSIDLVIQSHHHIDHSGAIREVMALSHGLNTVMIVGHDIELFYLTDVFGASSSFVPDTWETMGLRGEDATVVAIDESESMELINEDGLVVTAHNVPFDHSGDSIVTYIEVPGALYMFIADMYNAGLGLTIALNGPPLFFDYLRTAGVISEDCTSETPLFFIPAHGSIQSLEQSLAEMAASGIDVGCP